MNGRDIDYSAAVDQNINRTERILSLLDDRPQRLLIPQVGWYDKGGAALVADFFGDTL